MKRYRKLIKKGVMESITKIPFHNYAPIKRLSMLNEKLVPNSNTHIAIHFVNPRCKKKSDYSFLHKHNADEINLIISENGNLKYEIHKKAFKILEEHYKSDEFTEGRQKMSFMPANAKLILNIAIKISCCLQKPLNNFSHVVSVFYVYLLNFVKYLCSL